MAIYRLVPIADADDPNWDRAINHGEIVVRAVATGEARAIAALAEAEAATGRTPLATTQVRASAFMDEKLYAVRQAPFDAWPAEGPSEVLAGSFQFPDDYVPMVD